MWKYPPIVCLCFLFGVSCEVEPTPSGMLTCEILKWPRGRAAALSITYDNGWLSDAIDMETQRVIVEKGLQMDYELVTSSLSTEVKAQYIVSDLLPRGFQLFGHGEEHLYYDKQSYEECQCAFSTCFRKMNEFNLNPVAFAYPHGSGRKKSTQKAVREAGFLSARMFDASGAEDPYIVPYNVKEPKNWFALPTLIMESMAFKGRENRVNNTKDLVPFLDGAIQSKSWIILTYHAIGMPGGWGYYEMDDFVGDLDEIAVRDFWVASMNDVTLYVRERFAARAFVELVEDGSGDRPFVKIKIDDQLPNARFDYPLTVSFDIPEGWVGLKLGLFKDGEPIGEVDSHVRRALVDIPPDESTYIIQPLDH
jgi:hypothetical protein